MGLTPVGSGCLMILILIFGFCIKPHLAIDAELLSTAFTKSVGTVSLARHPLIDRREVSQVALSSVPACLMSLYVPRQLATSLMKKLRTGLFDPICPSFWPTPDSN